MAVIDDDFLQDMADLAADQALKDECQITRKTGDCNTYTLVDIVNSAVVNAKYPFELYEDGNVVCTVETDVLLPKGTETFRNDRLIIKDVKYRVIKEYSLGSYDVLARVAVITLQE